MAAVLFGAGFFISGCVSQSEPEFAMRNAVEQDLDLQSIVRGQSNTLLELTLSLEDHAKAGFAAQRRLDKDLDAAIVQLDELHLNLPSLLADQDLALETVRELVSEGALDTSALKAKQSEIQTYRKALLGSLDASATRAALTAQALSKTGMTAQTRQADRLSGDLKDARSSIALQM